jgi:hypothetical protein
VVKFKPFKQEFKQMPAIAEKHEHMDGQVYRYANTTTGWYYRAWDGVSRKYRTGRIPDATTLSDALANAYKV